MNGEVAEPPSRKKKLRRNSLGSQQGVIAEMTRLYRKVKAGELDADEGRSRVWMLERIGLRLEAVALEELHSKLELIAAMAAGTVVHGQPITDRRLIASH
jgi:hypothetical protein